MKKIKVKCIFLFFEKAALHHCFDMHNTVLFFIIIINNGYYTNKYYIANGLLSLFTHWFSVSKQFFLFLHLSLTSEGKTGFHLVSNRVRYFNINATHIIPQVISTLSILQMNLTHSLRHSTTMHNHWKFWALQTMDDFRIVCRQITAMRNTDYAR